MAEGRGKEEGTHFKLGGSTCALVAVFVVFVVLLAVVVPSVADVVVVVVDSLLALVSG